MAQTPSQHTPPQQVPLQHAPLQNDSLPIGPARYMLLHQSRTHRLAKHALRQHSVFWAVQPTVSLQWTKPQLISAMQALRAAQLTARHVDETGGTRVPRNAICNVSSDSTASRGPRLLFSLADKGVCGIGRTAARALPPPAKQRTRWSQTGSTRLRRSRPNQPDLYTETRPLSEGQLVATWVLHVVPLAARGTTS